MRDVIDARGIGVLGSLVLIARVQRAGGVEHGTGQMGGDTLLQGGIISAGALVLGGLVVSVLAVFAREPLHQLNEAVFGRAAEIFEGFGARTRELARAVLAEGHEALAQMQRLEFADEVFSRQRELIDVLDRFQGAESRHADLITAIRKQADAGDVKPTDRAMMRLAAELTAAHEQFNKHIAYLAAHEDVVRGVHEERVYTFSPFIRLMFASLFMPLILMGGVLNFFLIKRPLDTLFLDGGYTFAGGVTMAEVCAGTIIVIEAVVGFFFLEALRVTKVLPNFHDFAPRVRIVWASAFFLILVLLSIIEGALALWRENLIALSAAVETGAPVDLGAAPMVFQVLLGMLMPFILALFAIPLETFLKNARVVALFLLAGGIHLLALPLGLIGLGFSYVGGVVRALIDLVVFIPAAFAGRARTKNEDKA